MAIEEEYTTGETRDPILTLRQAVEMIVWINDNYLGDTDPEKPWYSMETGEDFTTKELVQKFLDEWGIE